MNTIKLSEAIRKARKDKGLNQVELAERLGVRQQTVQKWESYTNKNNIPLLTLVELGQVLDITVEIKDGEIKFNQEVLEMSEWKESSHRQDCEAWINSFGEMPTKIFEHYYEEHFDQLVDLTAPTSLTRVWVEEEEQYGVIQFFDGKEYQVELEDGEEVSLELDDFSFQKHSLFPEWCSIWLLKNNLDMEWVIENKEWVSQLGFRIYLDELEEYLFLGLDGGGYDFYERHWEPLYRARFSHKKRCLSI